MEVPAGSAKGHLNARLRWWTPMGLRRLRFHVWNLAVLEAEGAVRSGKWEVRSEK